MATIVTISDKDTNHSDEFMGIWDNYQSAQDWVDSEYPDWIGQDKRIHYENDYSWIGSRVTATCVTHSYKNGDRMVMFISPNQ